jgi:hypothetical protein
MSCSALSFSLSSHSAAPYIFLLLARILIQLLTRIILKNISSIEMKKVTAAAVEAGRWWSTDINKLVMSFLLHHSIQCDNRGEHKERKYSALSVHSSAARNPFNKKFISGTKIFA